jgi:hypothetical protein
VKYILLIWGDEGRVLNETEREQIYAGHRAYGEAMTKAGVIRGGAELKPPALGGAVRFRNGKPTRMDGPFAETKEQLGGYYIVETDTLQGALDWAAKMPGMSDGAVEVRELGAGA